MNSKKWLDNNLSNISKKVYVITGATGILGKNAMFYLLQYGAKVIMAVRNIDKANVVKKEMLEKVPNAQIDIMQLDVANVSSIDMFVTNLKQMYPQGIDGFVNNAGILSSDRSALYGYEKMFFTNFVGPFYMTMKLLDYLNIKRHTKLVFVSSIAYSFQKFDFDNIDYSHNKKTMKVYGNSKRFITFAGWKLKQVCSSDYQNIDVNIVHPGISTTNLFYSDKKGFKQTMFKIVKPIMKCVFTSPKYASFNILEGLIGKTNDYQMIGPKRSNVWGKPKIKTYTLSQNDYLDCNTCFELSKKLINEIKK